MLSQWLPDFVDADFLRNALASLIFFLVLMTIRTLMRRAMLRRSDVETEVRQRWLNTLRNSVVVVFLLGMALIWSSQIETLAVSLVAIAAAIVLATREMILCLMGTIYRSSSRAYSVGDRIEINGLKGQVIDLNMLSTTLLEPSHAMRKGTVGRVLTFPNSLLLTQPVCNETMLGNYVVHTMQVSFNRNADWKKAEEALLSAANAEVESYAKDLTRHAREMQRSYGLEAPALVPRLHLALDDRESVSLYLQLPVPLMRRGQIEQRILRACLEVMGSGKEGKEEDEK